MPIISIVIALSLAGTPVARTPVAPTPSRLDSRAQASQTSLRELIDRLQATLEQEDVAATLALVKAIQAHKDFADQPQGWRDAVNDLLGQLNLAAGNTAAALPYLRAAVARPDPSVSIWLDLVSAEVRLDDWTGAARDMTALLTRSPAHLDDVSARFLAQLALNTQVEDDTAFALRLRLAALSWSYDYDSAVWLALIDDLVTRDRVAEAVPLIAKVTESSARIRLHAMKVYDGLLATAGTPTLDIPALLDAELETRRRGATAPDTKIRARLDYGLALLSRARFEDALAEADAILALPAETWSADDEPDSMRRWTEDLRARALKSLDRRDDALTVARVAAAEVPEDGDVVSHRINLGSDLMRLGRFKEAIEAIGVIEAGEASPFGLMQASLVKACAAHALGASDPVTVALADREFAYLREHRKDAPDAWAEALGCRRDVEGIAALMVERLWRTPSWLPGRWRASTTICPRRRRPCLTPASRLRSRKRTPAPRSWPPATAWAGGSSFRPQVRSSDPGRPGLENWQLPGNGTGGPGPRYGQARSANSR